MPSPNLDNPVPEKLLLTAEECAMMLSLSRRTIYELKKSGDLQGVNIGRSWRIPVDEVRAYVRKLQAAATRRDRGRSVLAGWGMHG